MHEAGGEPFGAERRDRADHAVEEGGDRVGRLGGVGPVVGDRMLDEAADVASVWPRAARRWKLPMRMWLWLRRTSTDERVGDGSSPRVSASPVSISEKVLEV